MQWKKEDTQGKENNNRISLKIKWKTKERKQDRLVKPDPPIRDIRPLKTRKYEMKNKQQQQLWVLKKKNKKNETKIIKHHSIRKQSTNLTDREIKKYGPAK